MEARSVRPDVTRRTRIVVPCYNESQRFDTDAFARALCAQQDLDLVLVNDGSTDGTLGLLSALAEQHPSRVDILSQPRNAGKAEAVRQGMLGAFDAGARFAGYWDADLATPLDAIPTFVALLEDEAHLDFVLGSRVALLGHAIRRSPLRHYAGRVFATLASAALSAPVYDTQCGAKLIRCTALTRRLFEQPFASHWAFDVEILARYLALDGALTAIRELPLQTWTDIEGSKVRPVDFIGAVGDLVRIRRRYGRRLSRP